MMGVAIVLLACAIGVWPTAAASARIRRSRPARARRPGLRRLVGSAESAWWVPAAVLLLVRPGLGAAALLVSAGARASWRVRRARVLEREHANAVQSALMAVVDELRVGGHPAHAFAAASQECATADEVARTMREVAARARLGGDVGEGLRVRAEAARQAGLASGGALWDRIAASWELSHREGVPMAQAVGAARADLVERIRFGERTHAALAGARATVKILAALPVLCVLLGQAIGAAPLSVLLSGPGSFLLLLGCGLVCAGLAWSRRITAGAGG